MAVASSGVYAKGSLLGSDQDWYHGQLTRVEAEQALTASGCDCFLIREDGRALVLSLIHHGQVHHVNIKNGPGWYELESGSAQYSFTELDELVSHYSSEPISEQLKLTLGVTCTNTSKCITVYMHMAMENFMFVYALNLDMPHYETIPDTSSDLPHHYETINNSGIYSKGKPTDLMKYNWYHGNISEEQAEIAIDGNMNRFLVRHSDNKLILSYITNGWKSHDNIYRTPKGYRLEGKKKVCSTVHGLTEYYQQHPIKRGQILGNPADKASFGTWKIRKATTDILFKKV